MWAWIVRQYNDIRGNLKWAFLLGLWWLIAHYGKRMLQLIPNIAPWMVWAIIVCASFAVFIWIAKTDKPPTVNTQIQTPASNIPPAVLGVDRVEEFYQTYDNVLLKETEANIQLLASRHPPNERERFFVRFIAMGVLNFVFDTIWWTIYGSQIKALQKMNAAPLTREELRAYYITAAEAYPEAYVNYDFDKWVGYMRSQVLILEENDQVAITKRGREFLKYLVHFARPLDSKKF
jgi:hypothetical protein